MKKSSFYVITVLIALLGLSLFAYKTRVIGMPVTRDANTEVWSAEVRLSFEAEKGPVKLTLEIPSRELSNFAILEENFVSRSFGLSLHDAPARGRQAQWTVRRARGSQVLYYRVDVYKLDRERRERAPSFPPLPELDEPYASALQTLVDRARRESADIVSFAEKIIEYENDSDPSEEMALFLSGLTSPHDRMALVIRLLAGARIPARMVNGIQLGNRRGQVQIQRWLEVHDGDRWIAINPRNGDTGLPENFMVWWRGDRPMAQAEGAHDVSTQITVQRALSNALSVAERRAQIVESGAVRFSLLGLPIRTQAVYGVLLMIPIGALVMVLLRNVVGIKTFGTFMPVLIAISFRETELLGGILLFILILGLGLVARFVLERFHLLLVPRLAAVLIVVVLLMLVVSIISHNLGLEMGLSVALFPMVILAMTIERMSIVWEERGPREAIIAGAGSLLVASLCYLAMSVRQLEYLVFVFPELLLVVLAMVFLLGRYSGYRLSELLRFRSIVTDRS